MAAALQPQHLGKRQRRRVNYHEDNLAKKVPLPCSVFCTCCLWKGLAAEGSRPSLPSRLFQVGRSMFSAITDGLKWTCC